MLRLPITLPCILISRPVVCVGGAASSVADLPQTGQAPHALGWLLMRVCAVPCCPPTAEEMSSGLAQLGYDLEPSEVAILMQQLDIDADGQVCKRSR